MNEIFILSSKKYLKVSDESLVGLKNDKLISLVIKKEIIGNYCHHHIEESFEYCLLKPNEKPFDALFKRGKIYSEKYSRKTNYQLFRLRIKPGNYYPRIFRPISLPDSAGLVLSPNEQIDKLRQEIFNFQDYYPFEEKLLIASINQLATLKNMLDNIANNVYPTRNNLKSYGHNIKNLLVLSCIEVETHLKGVLTANGINPKRKFYTTEDFVKVKPVMQRDKYSVKLPFFPEVSPIQPFKKWDASNATKSLKWYDSYNSVKHNSENDFHKATLENAISAICAVAVLVKSQYGIKIPYWKEQLGGFFEISNDCLWSREQKILPPLKGNDWTPNKMNM